ncbi:major histocompatibility complex class I-related gene protein-like [Pseudoliparis swirei]|uniref:major histocompatibility complex class I-related gene protein-like n=1 Tax=Pseudoliparis swirei TaxID=2059687 RepID=UPI0024BDDCD4|nr:major histocompatibility complex class I-related gene protein-like [Pseudoliparis swirei]
MKRASSVSLLQKTPSSPVRCHAPATRSAALFWSKDGEELRGVDHGEILPNHDGSFQMSVDLKLSAVPAEDWRRYQCVFQLSGVEEPIVIPLEEAGIRTNAEKPSGMTTIIIISLPIIIITITLLAVSALALGRVMDYKKRKAECPPTSDNSSELSEKLNPETQG